METQTCVAYPEENGTMKLLSATQWMDGVQNVAAKALNVDNNKVYVEVNKFCKQKNESLMREN